MLRFYREPPSLPPTSSRNLSVSLWPGSQSCQKRPGTPGVQHVLFGQPGPPQLQHAVAHLFQVTDVVGVGVDHDLHAQLLGMPQVTVAQIQPVGIRIVLHGDTQLCRPPQYPPQVHLVAFAAQQQPSRRVPEDLHIGILNRLDAPAPSSVRVAG